MAYIQHIQQKFMCNRCGKPMLGPLMYAACQCAQKHRKSTKELRRSAYMDALVHTIRTARTAAKMVGSMPNPRLAGARR